MEPKFSNKESSKSLVNDKIEKELKIQLGSSEDKIKHKQIEVDESDFTEPLVEVERLNLDLLNKRDYNRLMFQVSQKGRITTNYFNKIDISSNLGMFIFKKYKSYLLISEALNIQFNLKIEKYCKPEKMKKRHNKFTRSQKHLRNSNFNLININQFFDKLVKQRSGKCYFLSNRTERKKRLARLEYGINERSYFLLNKCKPCQVNLSKDNLVTKYKMA